MTFSSFSGNQPGRTAAFDSPDRFAVSSVLELSRGEPLDSVLLPVREGNS